MPDAVTWSTMIAAAGVAVIHTLLGPDHYLPFIMLGRARRWSPVRAAAITAACGVGHVASSIVVGGLATLAGLAVSSVERIEQGRGSLAAWALVALGLAYALWGLRRALRRAGGLEPHAHADHVHLHRRGDRPHRHPHRRLDRGVTFWSLFAIFVLGPCEPLIPLLVLPASQGRWDSALWTTLVFGVTTVLTMVASTLAGLAGVRALRWRGLERWSHALAGGMIAASGAAILLVGV